MNKLKSPIIEVDQKAGAVYVVVAKGEIHKQQPILQGIAGSEKNFFVGDFDQEGNWIGFEIFGRFLKRRQNRRYGPGASPLEQMAKLKSSTDFKVKTLNSEISNLRDRLKRISDLVQDFRHDAKWQSIHALASGDDFQNYSTTQTPSQKIKRKS